MLGRGQEWTLEGPGWQNLDMDRGAQLVLTAFITFFFFFKQKVGEVPNGRLFGDYKEGSDLVCLGDLFNSG